MSNNPNLPSPTEQRHAQQQISQQQHQNQNQPLQSAQGGDVASEQAAYTTTGSSTAIAGSADVLPSVLMPAVTELISGRVSPRSMLTVVPEQRRQKGASTRRAFQPRRRSRACDQCRTRKTKVRVFLE